MHSLNSEKVLALFLGEWEKKYTGTPIFFILCVNASSLWAKHKLYSKWVIAYQIAKLLCWISLVRHKTPYTKERELFFK